MSQTPAPPPATDPRIYFAAERTLLAWVRTGLAMMGFGFVVARFGLFLRQLATIEGGPAKPQSGVAPWVGLALVLLGVAVNVFAAGRHWQTINRLDAQLPLRFHRASFGLFVAGFLAMLGLLVAGYLLAGV